MSTLLPALCAALRAAGAHVSLSRDYAGEQRCLVHPPTVVTQDLLLALRRYKPEILRLLTRADAPRMLELIACRRCGSDLVLTAGDSCRTCAQLTHVRIELEPCSAAESAYLRILNTNTEEPSQLSQAAPWDGLGQLKNRNCPTVPENQLALGQ